MIWESLAGERLFDGKTDVEIFKKIRACKITPIAELRPDVPPALAAVLEVALAPDPANRYHSATEFALALSQVMKQAVGVDPATALGTAVREARIRDRPADSDHASTLGGEAGLPVGSDAKTIPQTAAPTGRQTGQQTGSRPKRESVDVEFSSADIGADAIPLTPKKP